MMKHFSRMSAALLVCAVIMSGCTSHPVTHDTEESTPQSESLSEEPAGQRAKGGENQNSVPASDLLQDEPDSALSSSHSQTPSRSDQELHSYPVASVLDNAESLVGSRFIVIGNLPQNAPLDDLGQPMLFLLGDTADIRLPLEGEIGIGSCKAALTGTLLQNEDDQYIFQVESYKQL